MTDYTKSTNFATKDSLSSGNALKILKGTEIDTEFNNIQTAIATKADLTSPTFTGTPTLPTGTIAVTQSTSDSSTKVATTAFVQAALAAMYPVGSIYTNANVSTNPVSLLGFGTWEEFGTGRVLVGVDSGNALFDTVRETGGSADAIVVSHTHTATESSHTHSWSYSEVTSGDDAPNGGTTCWVTNSDSTGGGGTKTISGTTGGTAATVTVASTGSSGTNANLQPYITVYMWRRTA